MLYCCLYVCVLVAIWGVGSTCGLVLGWFGSLVRVYAGFSGLHFSACHVSCGFSFGLCVLYGHSAGGAVSGWSVFACVVGRLGRGMPGAFRVFPG